MNLSAFNELFAETANTVTGELKTFERTLALFKKICKGNELLFSLAEVEDYLADYK